MRVCVCVCVHVLSRSVVSDSATVWTIALQAPLSMGLFRQEYWSELPFPPPGDLPNSGIEPMSPVSSALQADCLPAEPSVVYIHTYIYVCIYLCTYIYDLTVSDQ